jgi:hypothetical protein
MGMDNKPSVGLNTAEMKADQTTQTEYKIIIIIIIILSKSL